MFETERLIIRPYEESDIKVVKQGFHRVDHLRYSSALPLAPLHDDIFKMITSPRQKHELPAYAVCHKPADYDPNKVVLGADAKPLPLMGSVTFQNGTFDFKNRHCDLGMGFYYPEDRGKGYGTEVLRWALDYGFYELGLHRIGLQCYSHNEPAIGLYRKLGFKEEGRLVETVYSAGKWYDTLIFGMLERHWPALRDRASKPAQLEQAVEAPIVVSQAVA